MRYLEESDGEDTLAAWWPEEEQEDPGVISDAGCREDEEGSEEEGEDVFNLSDDVLNLSDDRDGDRDDTASNASSYI